MAHIFNEQTPFQGLTKYSCQSNQSISIDICRILALLWYWNKIAIFETGRHAAQSQEKLYDSSRMSSLVLPLSRKRLCLV